MSSGLPPFQDQLCHKASPSNIIVKPPVSAPLAVMLLEVAGSSPAASPGPS